ncbi:MAG TPA: YciI family protein [Leptospiraceae bacterium]|nr:YciI family protein [Leptospiraceae bacterium]HRG77102.1 YciI family protein [Leptospiraceae bacterium]
MKFLLIIAHDNLFSPTSKLTGEIIKWNKEMSKKSFLLDSNPLVPAENAVTIRIRGKKIEKTKGPFSNSKEQIAAYVLIDCPSQREAIKIAKAHPMAKVATVEVRRVWEELSSM